MAKILTIELIEDWGKHVIRHYSRLCQQIFSKIFCAILDILCWHIEGRAQYDARDQLIIDRLFEPHHHPHIWRASRDEAPTG